MEMGEPYRAVEVYSEGILFDQKTATFYDQRAEAYGMLGEHRLAMGDYGRVLEGNPHAAPTHIKKAVLLFQLGRLEESIQDFNQEIEIYHDTIDYRGNTTEDGHLGKAGNLNSTLALAYNNRGSAYYQMGRIERAIEDYDQAIQLSPVQAVFYVNRSAVYELQHRDARAQQDLERAAQLGSNTDSVGRK